MLLCNVVTYYQQSMHQQFALTMLFSEKEKVYLFVKIQFLEVNFFSEIQGKI